MSRTKTISNLFSKKFKTLAFSGFWKTVMGTPEKVGVWIVYGLEKNGKTWFALKLAEYLSTFSKVLYVSAEEALSMTFVEAVKRANLDTSNANLQFQEYIPLDELSKYLKGKRSAKIVIIDNITVYKDELAYGGFINFRDQWKSKKLIIFIAHEKQNEPEGTTAKLVKKLSNIIIRVVGLTCFVSGRCEGGAITIDEKKSELFHGTNN